MMLRLDDRSSPWSNFLRRFTKDRVGMISLIVVALLILTAVVGPWVVPYDPENFFDYDHLNEGPSAMYWFGVDSLGRDVFSRIIAGTRLSLMTGLGSVFAGAVIGTVLGLLAGYYEGWTDRIVRGNVLVLKHETYVEAARSIGAGDAVIIFRHILPGTISVILVYLSMRIGSAIITASSLSFLGLGAQPPSPEWGAILNEAREDILTAPHAALFAVGAIFITVLAFNILGDALRDALDPKMRRD